MDKKVCIDDVDVLITDNNFIIQRNKEFSVFGNSIYNNGFFKARTILNHFTEDNNKITLNSEEYVQKLLNNDEILDPAAIMLTSAHINQTAVKTSDYITAVVSANISDIYGAGEIIASDHENRGSINTILLINKNLSSNLLIKSYSWAIEAKIAALWDLDLRNNEDDLATGNAYDSLVVACNGESNEYIDELELRILIGKCVRDATKKTILDSGFSKGVLDFIEGIGIKIEDLVDAGMELCVGVQKSEELYNKLHRQILKSLEDLNVVSFIIAGIRLEEDYKKHRVAGINVDDDPAYLYSDEVFGMSVANQIAGTKAIFNFKRYDEEKPGIIGELGPVLDDIFAGLIAGCMSKIFEE
ncbi:phosphatidylglycerophosphatase A [Methanobacterium oryzae]|uniref:phosphatidylglycerophosphatase A n=1 Tax=Methanobacterium oryzae TaxID=69540 RepID=UPI003D1C5DCE